MKEPPTNQPMPLSIWSRTRRVVGSNPIWGSDFFCVLLWLILYISLYFLYNMIILSWSHLLNRASKWQFWDYRLLLVNLFSIDYLWPVNVSGHLLKIILSPEVVFILQALLQSNEHTLTFSCFPACYQMYKWVEEILNALSYQVQSQGNPDQGAQCHQQGEFSKELLVFQP